LFWKPREVGIEQSAVSRQQSARKLTDSLIADG
jgi:hypothetical protein